MTRIVARRLLLVLSLILTLYAWAAWYVGSEWTGALFFSAVVLLTGWLVLAGRESAA